MSSEEKIWRGFFILEVILVSLKFLGVIHWSWWWVMAPVLPVAFVVLFAALIFYLAGLSVVYKKVKKFLSLNFKKSKKL